MCITIVNAKIEVLNEYIFYLYFYETLIMSTFCFGQSAFPLSGMMQI